MHIFNNYYYRYNNAYCMWPQYHILLLYKFNKYMCTFLVPVVLQKNNNKVSEITVMYIMHTYIHFVYDFLHIVCIHSPPG